jgi:hypothetical protein
MAINGYEAAGEVLTTKCYSQSRRRKSVHKRALKMLMPTAAGVLATLLMAGTALAAPLASARPANSATPQVSCSINPKQNAEIVASATHTRFPSAQSSFTSKIELKYSPTCRTVWAQEMNGDDAGGTGDTFWVYNENTGATKNATWPTTDTGAIDDTNTQSHACMKNDGTVDNENMPNICTAYF